MANIIEIFNKTTDTWNSYPALQGRSAYQSYLETTTDDPKKTEAEWIGSLSIAKYNDGDTVPTGAIVRIRHTGTPFQVTNDNLANTSVTKEKLDPYLQDKIDSMEIGTGVSDAILKNILKIKMRQSGLNLDTNAWSDTLENTIGINTGLSSDYYFDSANKSLKVLPSGYDSNHVGVWKFDETSGTSVAPTKGTAVGTCTGTTIVDGTIGKARSFNGVSDKIVFNDKVIPQGVKTIRFRMKQNGFPANDKAILCGSTSIASGANGDVVRLTTTGHVWYLLGQNSTFIINLLSAKNVCDNVWHDIMITWDGTTNAGAVKMYIDNILSVETATATTTQTTTPTINLNVGYDSTSSTSYYGGMIDELEISNVVRTYMISSGTATVIWNAVQSTTVLNKAVVESVTTLGAGTIKYYLSRDGGTTYTECTPDNVVDISSQPSTNKNVVMKVIITGNAELFAIAWGDMETGNALGLAPGNAINIYIIIDEATNIIRWTDPNDVVVDGVTIVKWEGTKLVRKVGSYPTHINDGVIILDNLVHNAYSDTGFVDDTIVPGTTYYYQLFPYSDTGAINVNELNRISSTIAIPMLSFFAIPSSTGKIRLKIEKPIDVESVMIRYKSTPWLEAEDHTVGTLVASITDDTNYKGPNKWYEVSGLTDGVAYYFKAFPYNGISYASQVGVNETVSKAGGLIAEYTMDSISGTTIYDTSGNNRNATAVNNITYEAGTIGNRVKGDAISARVDIPSSGLDLANKTITGFFKINSSPTNTQYLLSADSNTSFTNGSYYVSSGSAGICIMPKGTSGITYADKLLDNNFYCFKHTGNVCKVRRNAESNISITGSSVVSTDPSFPVRLFSARGGSSYFSNSSIDQLRFFNRELEDYEVDNIYNGGAGC